MRNVNYSLFDFNGTILDDVDVCLDILNQMLNEKNHPSIDKKRYLDIFTFPVIEYYKKAGFDLPKDDFDALAKHFFALYNEKSSKCHLYPGLVETLDNLKKLNKHLYVVSASEKNMLIKQLKQANIYDYFEDIVGQDDIKAQGKLASLEEFLKRKELKRDETVMVGDTLHDGEIAQKCHINYLLVADGHQSYQVLSKMGKPLHHIDELLEVIKE